MALTKISRGLLSTGISDSSDATAITIDSSENVLVGSGTSNGISGSTTGLQVAGAGFAGMISATRHDNNAYSSALMLGKSRNTTVGSNTIVQSGDEIGAIGFFADDGTNLDSQVAYIRALVDGTPGENDTPGRLTFSTTADGSAAATERMRIDSSGNVGIGTTTPTSYNASDKLTIANTSGNASLTIVGGTSGESSVFMADGTSGDASYRGYVQYQHTNDNFNIGTGGAQRLRVDSDGLKFGSDTAAQNALDDYEEGTWTPSLPEGGTVNTNYGSYYTKIGRQVIAYFYIVITPTNNNQQFKIGNLPFTCINQTGYYPSGSLGYSSNKDLSFLYPPLVMINNTYAYFHYNNGNANFVDNATMQKSGGLPIIGQVIYNAA